LNLGGKNATAELKSLADRPCVFIRVLEIGDETGEAVAWLPAGQCGPDVKATGGRHQLFTSCRSYLSIPPSVELEVRTLFGRRIRRRGGGVLSHVAMKDRKTLAHYTAAR